jgi:hypothetical protein
MEDERGRGLVEDGSLCYSKENACRFDIPNPSL